MDDMMHYLISALNARKRRGYDVFRETGGVNYLFQYA